MTATYMEPARSLPVRDKADVCIAGGSCTGVFAAVRAARMGCSVVLCEEMNVLGGVAVTGLVNIWHTLMDMDDREQVIAGLTEEDGRILYETMYEVLPYTIWFQIPLLLFGADWVKAAVSVLVFLIGVAAGALAGKRKVYRHWQERKQYP